MCTAYWLKSVASVADDNGLLNASRSPRIAALVVGETNDDDLLRDGRTASWLIMFDADALRKDTRAAFVEDDDLLEDTRSDLCSGVLCRNGLGFGLS